MALNRESLEGGVRLAQVRKIKKFMILAQALVVIGAALILTLIDGNIHLEPFYFNITSIIYIVVLILLVIGLENFIFNLLELKFLGSSSEKYYLLKTSARRSIVVIVVAAIVLVLLATPFLANMIANIDSQSGRTSSTTGFMNQGPMGLTVVDKVKLRSDQPTEVIFLTEKNYKLYAGNMTLMRQHSVLYMTSLPNEQSVDFPQIPFEKFYMVVDTNNPYNVEYTFHRTLSPGFIAFATMFSALFIGFYAVWVFTTRRLNKQYAKAAIYR
jgi:hypothetical protein